MRTLKEQEYQDLTLKYRSLAAFYEMLLEAIIGGTLTYLLLQWHWAPAGIMGTIACMGTIVHFKRWQRYAAEYRKFHKEFESMSTRALVDKIMNSVTEGDRVLARMKQEMEDDTTE